MLAETNDTLSTPYLHKYKKTWQTYYSKTIKDLYLYPVFGREPAIDQCVWLVDSVLELLLVFATLHCTVLFIHTYTWSPHCNQNCRISLVLVYVRQRQRDSISPNQ